MGNDRFLGRREQELEALLADPLQPAYSRKFFAGRPSAAALLEESHSARHGPGTLEGTGQGEAAAGDLAPTAAGVARTVALAQRLVGSRDLGFQKGGKPGKGRGSAGGSARVAKPWLAQGRPVRPPPTCSAKGVVAGWEGEVHEGPVPRAVSEKKGERTEEWENGREDEGMKPRGRRE